MNHDINLTREQRLECYKGALAYFEQIKVDNETKGRINYAFICPTLEQSLYKTYGIIIPLEIEVAPLFDELLSLKPDEVKLGNTWWDIFNIDIRIEKLNECINLIKDENETQSR